MPGAHGNPLPPLWVAGVALLLAAVLGGCSDDQKPQNVGAESGPATGAKPTDPAAYQSYISGGANDKVDKRSSLTSDLKADLLVRVSYTDGKVTPKAEDIKTQVGDEIRIEVTTDKQQQVRVSGYPGATTEIGPDQTGVIEFSADQQGRITATMNPSGDTLVSFIVLG